MNLTKWQYKDIKEHRNIYKGNLVGSRLAALCFFMFGGLLMFLRSPDWVGALFFISSFVALTIVLKLIDAREARQQLVHSPEEEL